MDRVALARVIGAALEMMALLDEEATAHGR
jgi:hypothetical protein